jgi:hypothetical protein
LKMVNVRHAVHTVLRWSQTNRHNARASNRIDLERHCSELKDLRPDVGALTNDALKNGVVALPGYWSADQCTEARREIDRLELAYPERVHHYSGDADHRMFGVESASPLLEKFHADPFARKFGEVLCGLELYNFATLAGHIHATPSNRGSGEGWHRDAHGFQFKAILYLSDTSPQNGPFEYLIGSHKALAAGIDTALGDLPAYPDTRYTDTQIERLNRKENRRRSFPASAGTLLLVFTSGIHRGQPLLSGERYALTNYYFHRAAINEGQIEKFAPLMPGTAERIRRDVLE